MFQNDCLVTKDFTISDTDRRTQQYPNIDRLCRDFGLQVNQLPETGGAPAPGRKAFALTVQQSPAEPFLTPLFSSMSQLETFVAENMVDILHSYLCGDAELS